MLAPQPSSAFEYLKEMLLHRTTPEERVLLRPLLGAQKFGDHPPSQLLHEMQGFLLKFSFWSCLPNFAKAICSAGPHTVRLIFVAVNDTSKEHFATRAFMVLRSPSMAYFQPLPRPRTAKLLHGWSLGSTRILVQCKVSN